MAPYLKYGSYQHGQGECSIVISRDAIYSESGIRKGWMERWDISGRLQPADESQAGVTAAITALEDAYKTDGEDLALYLDTGTLTSHYITSSTTTGGTRVVRGPSFPTGEGAEYNVYRTYSIAVEAERPDNASDPLLHWAESISWRGTGGPDWGYLPTLTGPPQPQTFTQTTPVRMIQRGAAEGNGAYPTPADPLWPQNELQAQRQTEFVLPRRNTTERRISWSFSFLSDRQLPGYPTEK